MKKKISFLLSVFIALIYLSSCDRNDFTQELIQPNTSSASVEKSFALNAFMPLNYIPIEASKQMTFEEHAVWQKVGSQFYISYGIIETDFYEKHKQEVLNLALKC